MILTEEELFDTLKQRFPDVRIYGGNRFRCHIYAIDYKVDEMEIEYNSFCTSFTSICTGLLHEFGHYMDKGLWDYADNRDTVRKEVTAWRNAIELSEELDIFLDRDHMDHCLATYKYDSSDIRRIRAHHKIRDNEYRFSQAVR